MMWIECVLVFLVLTDLTLLVSSLLGASIRLVAVQGLVLGALPILTLGHGGEARAWALALGTMALKGVVFPHLLFKVLRDANVRREMEPMIGYALSLTLGVAALWLAFRLSESLHLNRVGLGSLVMPAALFTVFTGFFLIIGRRKALTQVLGYLVMENGVYAAGLVLVGQVHYLIELGILLDVFVAVFIMGIAIYHMNREFDHIDVEKLTRLKG